MAQIYKASYVSLHVRKTNRAAISLYRDSLGFQVHDVEASYCGSTISLSSPSCNMKRARGRLIPHLVRCADADGEDAYGMRLELSPSLDV